MTENSPKPKPRETKTRILRRQKRGRRGFWMLAVIGGLIVLTGIGYVTLPGRPLAMPDWVTERVEERLNRGIAQGGVDLDRLSIELSRSGAPEVTLRNVGLRDARGVQIAQLNEVGAQLSARAFLEGRIAPSVLRVSGAQVTARRALDGAFTVSFGQDNTPAMGSVSTVLDTIDRLFSGAPLADVARLEADDVTITLEDARSARVWQVTDGRVRLVNEPERVSITVVSEVFNGTEDLAQVQMSFLSTKGSGAAQLGVQIENAAAQDIALQTPVLSYLGILDAPVSGAMRIVFDDGGILERFDATLEIAGGALLPEASVAAVPFNSGRAYLSYDPERRRIGFSELSVQSDALRLVSEGHAYLDEFQGPWPQSLLGQIRITELELAPEGMFAEPVDFEAGFADFRMRLDPFSVEFGQVALIEENGRFHAEARVDADPEGWRVALDAHSERLTPDQLARYWPVSMKPRTRDWLSQNVTGGVLTDAHAAVRLAPERPPRFGITYDFEDATVRFLPEMPQIENGAGHAALIDGAYSMRVDSGTVASSSGGMIDLSGSTMEIIDVREKPAVAEFFLTGGGALGDLLDILNNPPLRVLERSGREGEVAQAMIALDATLRFPLEWDLKAEEVDYRVTGSLANLRSEALVPGRTLTAQRAAVTVSPEQLEISGAAALDGVPLDIVWRQPLNSGELAPSEVAGRITLGPAFVEAFGLPLPQEAFSGEAVGLVNLTVPREGPVDFSLVSDLRGLSIDVPAIGWTKTGDAAGALEIAGTFGETPAIDTLRIASEGLAGEGVVLFDDSGAFAGISFPDLRIGNWFDGALALSGRGEGQSPEITVEGGAIDLRNLPSRDASADGAQTPMRLSLDRLVVSDSIALSPFVGRVTSQGGLDGIFEARVNGGAAVTGSLVPQNGRTAVRMLAEDGGAVIRDAGIFRSFDGGAMELILLPRSEGEGYDGRMRMQSTRLRDQPVIADILDAVSIIGIIDQLEGPGILFESVDADFRLLPDRVILDQGAAVGASLGISLDGIYDTSNERLEMQGVISPIYLLNAVGQIFTRRGEGLFGFSFTMTGDAEAPRVQVNPLSILTPGMFREIFRRAPPDQQRATDAQRQAPPELPREQP